MEVIWRNWFLEKGAEVFALVRPESSHLEALPKDEKLHMVSCGLSNVMDCIGRSDRQMLSFILPGVV